jgi:formate dehydrogenase maturation protein FdhE
LCDLKKKKQEQERQNLNSLLQNEEHFLNYIEKLINNYEQKSEIDIKTLVEKLSKHFVEKKNAVFIFNPLFDRCMVLFFQYLIINAINTILNQIQPIKNVLQDTLVTVSLIGIFNYIEKFYGIVVLTVTLLFTFVIVYSINYLLEK